MQLSLQWKRTISQCYVDSNFLILHVHKHAKTKCKYTETQKKLEISLIITTAPVHRIATGYSLNVYCSATCQKQGTGHSSMQFWHLPAYHT